MLKLNQRSSEAAELKVREKGAESNRISSKRFAAYEDDGNLEPAVSASKTVRFTKLSTQWAFYTRIILILTFIWTAILCAFLWSPFLQRAFIFFHWVPIPLMARFDQPMYHGLLNQTSFKFHVNTSDGQQLGCWYIGPADTSYHDLSNEIALGASLETVLPKDRRPIFLYFHGNAGNRAEWYRVALYKRLSEHLNAHVIAFDYRGFGDSTGSPTESTVQLDAHALFRHLTMDHQVAPDRIQLIAHSLGTSIASRFLATICEQLPSHCPAGLTLLAPFTAIRDVFTAYPYTRPVLLPLLLLHEMYTNFDISHYIQDSFDTMMHLQRVPKHVPILLIHGDLDWEISHQHSRRLFVQLTGLKLEKGHSAEKQLNPASSLSSSVQYWNHQNVSLLLVNGAGHNDIQSEFVAVYDLIRHEILS